MSNNTIYNGTSDGFSELSEGYIDYGKEVIARRSFPEVRDGLKPVGRRCIFGASNLKDRYLVKSLTLVGEIAKLHPHGDSSVYGALCNMTDSNGTMRVAPFAGQGELGHVYQSGSPAAMRYTKAKLGTLSQLYLRDMVACNMVPAEEGDGYEPEVLPVRFPAALVNGTSGMAVSASTFIPSFNVLDVINLTQEYLKTGECSTVIVPDFPTGGILVRDDSELTKIMHTGKGKLKIRARVEIHGKEIHVMEVPFGRTQEGIVKAINKLDLKDIASAHDTSGSDSSQLVIIKCKTLKSVEGVLLQLYKHRILQTSIASNMIFVEKEEPVIDGAYGVIKRWVAWREEVVKKMFNIYIDDSKEEITKLGYFVQLVSQGDKRDKFLDILVHNSRKEARAYLMGEFEDMPESVAKWITGISAASFNDGGSERERYNKLVESVEYYKSCLADVKGYIWQDLEDMKADVADVSARLTEETYMDYRFSKVTEQDIVDDSPCVYTIYKNGFMTKTRDVDVADKDMDKVLTTIRAQANSTLIGFDCFGRILRVYGTDFNFTKYGDRGEYLPKYFNADGYDGYEIKYMGLLDGTTRMLVYRDGFVGFLDTSEWVDSRQKVRTIQKGVDVNVYNALLEVVEEKDIPEYLVVAEDHTKVRFGVTRVSAIRRAGRKSRARVFSGSNLDLQYLAGMTYMELMQFMEDPFFFIDRVRPLGSHRVYGDTETIMKEGRYYE